MWGKSLGDEFRSLPKHDQEEGPPPVVTSVMELRLSGDLLYAQAYDSRFYTVICGQNTEKIHHIL